MPFFFIFLTTDIFMICILSASQFASLQVKLWHKWIQCGLRGCYYLWWNPCLLSLAFFLNCRWRRPANFLSKLHHSSQVVPAFTSSTRVRLFANSTKGMFLLEESWKWFQEAESFSGEKARGGRGGSVPKSIEDDPFGKCYVARVWAHCEPSWHKSIKLRQSGRGARRASGLQGVNLKILLSKRLSTWVRGNFRGESVGQSCERVKSILRLSCAPGRAAGDLFSFLRRVSCFVWKHQLSEISVEKGENRPGNKKRVLCSGCLVEQ